MGRRKGRLRTRNLVIGAGLLVVIFVMIGSFPFITNLITGGDESTEFAFAFPEIDNSVITNLFPAILIAGQETTTKITAVDCFFKFSLVAKDTSGNIIESRESGFSAGFNPFTTFSIATVAQTTSSGETVIGGRTIDRYEITPKMRCDRDIINPDNQKFESGIAVLPSTIKLTTAVVQPDGNVRNLGDRSLTIQSIGADNNCNAFDTNTWVIGVGASIFPPTLGQQGILKDNQEIEFKGTLGATKCPNEFFHVSANDVNNIAKPELQTYNTEIRFALTGNLNMNYIFLPEDKTQALPLSGLSKTVRINVDRIQDVPASEFPQSIVLLSAISQSGKCLAGACGAIKNLNPDVASDRAITVIAELEDFQGVNVEGTPTLTFKKVIGGTTVSGISGGNPKLMSFAGNDRFTASMTLPSSIADATYIFQVTSQTRSNVGVGTISVITPPPDDPEIPTCSSGEVLDNNNMCVPDPTNGGDPTNPTCSAGFTLRDGQCVQVFCPDGTPSTDGCTITPVVGGNCLQGQIEELDGTCTNPLCQSGTSYDQSSQRCIAIVCPSGQEFDTVLDECVAPPSGTTACGLNEVRQDGICVSIGTAVGAGNILNIRQELRYQLLTSDQSGLNTPVQFGTIPEDESLFAGLTQLQFLTETPSSDLVKFDQLLVNSFLIVPQTVSSPDITNVKLSQDLKLYYNNVILTSGITKNPDQPALAVNIPLGTFGQTNRPIGGGFFALGNMEISTAEIVSAVEGLTTGITLQDGDRVSAMYVIDGTFDLTTGIGDDLKEFDGTIGQMRYWTNLIFTDKALRGDECIGLIEKELLRCNFEATGNNSLEGVCPDLSNEELGELGVSLNDPEAIEVANFNFCLDSIDSRTVGAIQNSICEDSDKLAGMVDLLNTGDKSTEEILADLKSGFGCECKLNEKLVNGQCIMKDPSEITTFVCPAGTEQKEGVEIASTVDDCEAKDPCSEENTGIVGGGTLEANADGTFKCVQPPTTPNGGTGTPQCQTGTERNPETGQCEFPPEKEDDSSVAGINALFAGLAEFLKAFSNTNDGSLTSTGSNNGQTNDGGACTENILNCIGAFLVGDDEQEEVTIDTVIPPSLQIAGSGSLTLIIIFVIIISVIIIGIIVRRRQV